MSVSNWKDWSMLYLYKVLLYLARDGYSLWYIIMWQPIMQNTGLGMWRQIHNKWVIWATRHSKNGELWSYKYPRQWYSAVSEDIISSLLVPELGSLGMEPWTYYTVMVNSQLYTETVKYNYCSGCHLPPNIYICKNTWF